MYPRFGGSGAFFVSLQDKIRRENPFNPEFMSLRVIEFSETLSS